MKNIFLLFALALLLACNSAKEGMISGTISETGGKAIILNRVNGKQAAVLEQQQMNGSGQFAFDISSLSPRHL